MLMSIIIILINANKNNVQIEPKVENNTENNSNVEKTDKKIVSYDLTKLIENYISLKNIDKNSLAISIHSYKTNEIYNLNENNYFTAASIYKLYMAIIYYDMINEGKFSLDDSLTFEDYMYEPGGFVGDTYSFGDKIDIKSLLHYSISDSDNSASHILFENLGGWMKLKNIAKSYTTTDTSNEKYNSFENVVTSSFIMDFLDKLHKNKDNYTLLIDDMMNSTPREYLNGHESMYGKLAQKYGNLDGVDNAAGIYLDEKNPYSIVILTSMNGYGEKIISDISEIVYNYFLTNKEKSA